MKHVRRKVTYAVGRGDVRLAVTIGSGQIGATVVFRRAKELGTGGSLLALPLGPGADLAGTSIEVQSLVQDVLTQTNRVSVEYVLTGGLKKRSFVARTTVPKQLDPARFTTTIAFAKGR